MKEDEIKRAMKEALKEWMSERFEDFGRWSMMAVLAAFFVAMVYFVLVTEGWIKK